MNVIQLILDFFRYSEGNITGMLYCLYFSIGCIGLMFLSFILERMFLSIKREVSVSNRVDQTVWQQTQEEVGGHLSNETTETFSPNVETKRPESRNVLTDNRIVCPGCGRVLFSDAVFCKYCGQKIK